MKHDGQFPFASGLPDAPLAMPKQQLERSRTSFFASIRQAFLVLSWR